MFANVNLCLAEYLVCFARTLLFLSFYEKIERVCLKTFLSEHRRLGREMGLGSEKCWRYCIPESNDTFGHTLFSDDGDEKQKTDEQKSASPLAHLQQNQK